MPRKYQQFHVTIGKLMKKVSRGEIDLNPSYQRNIVWKLSHKRDLIETLQDGLPVPLIFFCDRNEEVIEMETFDGKNRIGAIHLFHNDGFKNKDGKLFSQLCEKEKDFLEETELACISFNSSAFKNVAEKEQYFIKLQSGTNMSVPEQLHARTESALNLMIDPLTKKHLAAVNSISRTNRYQHHTFMTNLIHIVNYKKEVPFYPLRSTQLERYFDDPDLIPIDASTEGRCGEIIELIGGCITRNKIHSKIKEQFSLCMLNYIHTYKIARLSEQQHARITAFIATTVQAERAKDQSNSNPKKVPHDTPSGVNSDHWLLAELWFNTTGAAGYNHDRWDGDTKLLTKIVGL